MPPSRTLSHALRRHRTDLLRARCWRALLLAHAERIDEPAPASLAIGLETDGAALALLDELPHVELPAGVPDDAAGWLAEDPDPPLMAYYTLSEEALALALAAGLALSAAGMAGSTP